MRLEEASDALPEGLRRVLVRQSEPAFFGLPPLSTEALSFDGVPRGAYHVMYWCRTASEQAVGA